MAAVTSLRRHELLRVVIADLAHEVDLAGVGTALSDLAGATVHVALEIAVRKVEEQVSARSARRWRPSGWAGFGGGEMGYASDADAIFVHRATGEVSTRRRSGERSSSSRRCAGCSGPRVRTPRLSLDNDLRPEGKAGPLVRSLAAYTTYYARWAATGSSRRSSGPVRWAATPILVRPSWTSSNRCGTPGRAHTDAQVRDIRLMKARVEAERLPRGGDRRTHLKARTRRADRRGVDRPGGAAPARGRRAAPADDEHHGGPRRGRGPGHVSPSDARSLRAGWTLAASMRNASVLWRGRPSSRSPPTCATETASDGSSGARRVHRRPWRRTTSGWPAAAGPPPTCASTDSPGLSRRCSVTRVPGLGTNQASMPPLSQVFAVRGYLALFIAASLSTWGDYIARLTIAAVVYQRTDSPSRPPRRWR